MTPIEIMALLVVSLGLIKTVVILIDAKKWMGVAKAVYGNPQVTQVIALALAGLSLWYLLQELTIVQVWASMAFFMMVMVLSAAVAGKELLALANKLLRQKNLLQKWWLATLVWVGLSLWVLKELFM